MLDAIWTVTEMWDRKRSWRNYRASASLEVDFLLLGPTSLKSYPWSLYLSGNIWLYDRLSLNPTKARFNLFARITGRMLGWLSRPKQELEGWGAQRIELETQPILSLSYYFHLHLAYSYFQITEKTILWQSQTCNIPAQ